MAVDKTEAQPIDLYDAIEQMKRISLAGGTFSLTFRKWNRQTRNGGYVVKVNAARIRPKTKDDKFQTQVINYFSPIRKQASPVIAGRF